MAGHKHNNKLIGFDNRRNRFASPTTRLSSNLPPSGAPTPSGASGISDMDTQHLNGTAVGEGQRRASVQRLASKQCPSCDGTADESLCTCTRVSPINTTSAPTFSTSNATRTERFKTIVEPLMSERSRLMAEFSARITNLDMKINTELSKLGTTPKAFHRCQNGCGRHFSYWLEMVQHMDECSFVPPSDVPKTKKSRARMLSDMEDI